MSGPRFILKYFVSFLILKSSRWGKVGWLFFFLSCDCKCPVSFPGCAMDEYVVCDGGISWSYSLTFLLDSKLQFHSNYFKSTLCKPTVQNLIRRQALRNLILFCSDCSHNVLLKSFTEK